MLDKKTRDRLYYIKNKATIKAKHYSKIYKQRHRRLCIEYYSDNKVECACCHESMYEFLTIDHINGGGHKHKQIHRGALYSWLIKNGFPEGYMVLCYNCNCAKGLYGSCPHSLLIYSKTKSEMCSK